MSRFRSGEETIPGAARLRTAGRGITAPEPGRTEAPYWITSEAEARKVVQELAAKKVDFVKIWVDDRDGKFKKLTPALYGAVIDEAHKNKLRVTAHLFTLEDAKGLAARGPRRVRSRRAGPGHRRRVRRPDQAAAESGPRARTFRVGESRWISAGSANRVPADELKKLQAGATDQPDAQQAFGIQARNLAKLNASGSARSPSERTATSPGRITSRWRTWWPRE